MRRGAGVGRKVRRGLLLGSLGWIFLGSWANTRVCHAGKLLDVLRAFPKDEPTKKRFVNEMIAWSARAGEYPNGDPELHHVAGTLFAEGTYPTVHVFTNLSIC